MTSFTLTTTLMLSLVMANEKTEQPKILARSNAKVVPGAVVIRSAEQLGKLRSMDADKASAELAKQLKVKSIDWEKQMVIVISGGQQRTGGYSVDVKSLEVKEKKLVVNWKLNSPPPGSFTIQVITNPTLTILVDRFAGDVVFEPKSPPAAKGLDR